MPNRFFVALFTTLAFLACAANTRLLADVTLYSQQTDNNNLLASQNDTGMFGFGNFATAYDNFTLATANSVDAVTWVGSYYNPQIHGTITAFTLKIYANSGGTPGAVLNTTSLSGNAGETSLGSDNLGDLEYSYSANLSTAFAAAAGTEYWLSIVPDLAFPPQWGWEDSSGAGDPGDHHAYQVYMGTGSGQSTDLAFTLRGNPAGAVPEPYSVALLGTVLGLIAIGARRRKGSVPQC